MAAKTPPIYVVIPGKFGDAPVWIDPDHPLAAHAVTPEAWAASQVPAAAPAASPDPTPAPARGKRKG